MKSLGRRMPRTTISFFIFLQYDDNHCAFAWKLCERGNNENERRNKTESTQFNTCLTLFSVFCFRYSMLWSSSCLASCHFTTALCCSCTFDANNSCYNASVRMKQHTDSLGLRCIWLKYKLACSQHKNPTIKPTVAHAMKHSLPVTFRRQCSHRCSQSERKAAERWGVRKRLLIFKRRREPRSTLHLCFCSICRSEIGNGAIESLEAELWENPCCVMILVNTAFVLTVYCVLNLPWVNAAAILCCYSLHAFKVFASWDNKPSSITTNWEIKCVFVLGWLILLLFFFFADLETAAQWCTPETVLHACLYWIIVRALLFSATRGHSATAQWTHYYCNHCYPANFSPVSASWFSAGSASLQLCLALMLILLSN